MLIGSMSRIYAWLCYEGAITRHHMKGLFVKTTGLILTAALWGAAFCIVSAPADAQNAPPPISHPAEREAKPGPGANFTGSVTVEGMVQPVSPGRTSLGLVRFSPGARSNWHSHPAGQTLYVTDGCGWTQREGSEIMRICAGDVVYVPAGVRHWHGATATTKMAHLAIQESIDGRNVDWGKPVTDGEYLAGKKAR